MYLQWGAENIEGVSKDLEQGISVFLPWTFLQKRRALKEPFLCSMYETCYQAYLPCGDLPP